MDCLHADGDNIDTEYMFRECTELLFVDISKIKISILKSTFHGCGKLEYVFLPDKVQEIKKFSFYGCSKLKLVTNIENYSTYHILENFDQSTNLLYFIAKKGIQMYTNKLKCKYFDSSEYLDANFYPTNDSSYIIITDQNNFKEYVKDGYKGKFLMSKNDKEYLRNVEAEEVKKEKEEEKKEKEENIKEKKEKKETFWKIGIVNERIVAFEDFKFNDKDFKIVKNENEKEVKTVDQIFYKFVQDEIKDINNRLIRNMEEWNNRDEKEKTYKNFKKVFVFNYERKNLFVPELGNKENNNIKIN